MKEVQHKYLESLLHARLVSEGVVRQGEVQLGHLRHTSTDPGALVMQHKVYTIN